MAEIFTVSIAVSLAVLSLSTAGFLVAMLREMWKERRQDKVKEDAARKARSEAARQRFHVAVQNFESAAQNYFEARKSKKDLPRA